MSDLPSVEAKIQVEATRFRSAVSEFLAQGIGSSINFLIDENTAQAARLTALEGVLPNVVFGAGSGAGASSFTATITPGATTGPILIIAQNSGSGDGVISFPAGTLTLKRGAATLASWSNDILRDITFIDLPAVTTATTYTFSISSGAINFMKVVLSELR